jgi:hypothetical protein
MIRPSNDMNNLTSDIRHLSTVVGVITSMALDIADPDKQLNEICDLLWIARDMVEQLVENGEACHDKVLAETAAAREAVAV